MISGANEKELDLATARADILLMCGAEQLKMVDEYYENQITNLQQENKQLKETLKDIEELLLSEEQPVQPCNIRYDILEIIKKALGDKE